MRIYMIKGSNNSYDRIEKCLGFVRSEVQAKKAVKIMQKELSFVDIHYVAEDIGAGKGGLIEWLNDFAYESTVASRILNEVMK